MIYKIHHYAVSKIVENSGLNQWLIKGIVIIALIPLLWVLPAMYIGKYKKAARAIGLIYLGAFFLTLYFVNKDIYFSHSGRDRPPLKWYAITPEGVRYYDGPGVDTTYGIPLKPVTPDIIKKLRMWESKNIKLLDPHKTTFFNPITGEPQAWYYRDSEGSFEFYDKDAFHPTTGEKLKPITKEVILEWKEYDRKIKEKVEQSKQKTTERKEEQKIDQSTFGEQKTEIKTRPAVTKIRLRKIIGVAYSYTRKSWASLSSLGGSYYPRVGLEFRSGLVSPYATIDWDGSYSIEGNQLCLYIKDLKVPNSSALQEFYLDFGVGYGIELENAVFDDYTVSKVAILFRTFLGDTPPKDIKKCYGIRVINQVSEEDYRIGGEWEGEYIGRTSQYEREKIPFVARIVQSGNRFEGSVINISGATSGGRKPGKSRCKIEGWVIDGRITFIKKYENSLYGVSYVASFSGDSTELSGAWFSGLDQGDWYMKRKGNFIGSPDDIFSPDKVSSNEEKARIPPGVSSPEPYRPRPPSRSGVPSRQPYPNRP